MIYVFYTVHVVVSLFLILVVLLQQGKGADLSVFGGGGTQTAFGVRGAATILHKLTVICFVMFILTTLSIGILQTADDPTVMSGVEATPDDEEDTAPLSAPAGGTLPSDDTTAGEDAATEDPPAADAASSLEDGEANEGDPPASEPDSDSGEGSR